MFAIVFQFALIIGMFVIAVAFHFGQKFGIAAEQNIGTATGHVRGNRDSTFATSLSNNLGFTLVIFGIQNIMFNAKTRDSLAENFAFFDADSTDQNRLTGIVACLNLLRNGLNLFFFIKVNDVLIILTDNLSRRRDADNIEFINFLEFLGFGIRCTRHTRKFLIHAEIILEGNRGQSLAFGLNFHALFGLNRLMQTIRPAAAMHHTPRKVINNDNFAVLNDIVLIEFIKRMSLQSLVHVMQIFDIFRVINIIDFQMTFEFLNTRFIQGHALILLVNGIIFIALEERHEFINFFIKIEILFKLS